MQRLYILVLVEGVIAIIELAGRVADQAFNSELTSNPKAAIA
ncbi:hypothetical protein [Coleofasciculus sp. F4-SAH-05]